MSSTVGQDSERDETPKKQPGCGFSENLASEVAGEAARKTMMRSIYIMKGNKPNGDQRTAEEKAAALAERYFKRRRGSSIRRGTSIRRPAVVTVVPDGQGTPSIPSAMGEQSEVTRSAADDILASVEQIEAGLQDIAQTTDPEMERYNTMRRIKSGTVSVRKMKRDKGARERAGILSANFFDKPDDVGSESCQSEVSASAEERGVNSDSVISDDNVAELTAATLRTLDKATEGFLTRHNSVDSPPQPQGVPERLDMIEADSESLSVTPLKQVHNDDSVCSATPITPPLPSGDTSKLSISEDQGMDSDEDEDNKLSQKSRLVKPCTQQSIMNEEALAVIKELEAEKTELEYLVDDCKDRIELLEVDFDSTNIMLVQKKNELLLQEKKAAKLEDSVGELQGMLQVREVVLRENGVLLPKLSARDQKSVDRAIATARDLFQKALVNGGDASSDQRLKEIKELQAERDRLLLLVENSPGNALDSTTNNSAPFACSNCSSHSEEIARLHTRIEHLKLTNGDEERHHGGAAQHTQQSPPKELLSLQEENCKLQAALAELCSRPAGEEARTVGLAPDFCELNKQLAAVREENAHLEAQLVELQTECFAARDALAKSSSTCSLLSGQVTVLQRDSQQLAHLRQRETEAEQLAAEVLQLSEQLLHLSKPGACTGGCHYSEEVQRLREENALLRTTASFETGSSRTAELRESSQDNTGRNSQEPVGGHSNLSGGDDFGCLPQMSERLASPDVAETGQTTTRRRIDAPSSLLSLETFTEVLHLKEETKGLRTQLQEKVRLLVKRCIAKDEEAAYSKEETARLQEENGRLLDELAKYEQLQANGASLTSDQLVLKLECELSEVRDQLKEERLWLLRTAEKLVRVEFQNFKLQTDCFGSADSFRDRPT